MKNTSKIILLQQKLWINHSLIIKSKHFQEEIIHAFLGYLKIKYYFCIRNSGCSSARQSTRLGGVWSQVRILSSRLPKISHLQSSKWLIYFLVEHIWDQAQFEKSGPIQTPVPTHFSCTCKDAVVLSTILRAI